MPRHKALYKYTHTAAQAITVIVVFFIAVYVAQFFAQNAVIQDLVGQFGYVGMFTVAMISGFNLLVPIHAATFTPLFVEAGFPLLGIIATLVVGMTLSDLISFEVAVIGKSFAYDRYKKEIDWLDKATHQWRWTPSFAIFVWAVVAPVPNELLLVPLAILGVPLQRVIVPLLIGNVIHMGMFVYGVSLL